LRLSTFNKVYDDDDDDGIGSGWAITIGNTVFRHAMAWHALTANADNPRM